MAGVASERAVEPRTRGSCAHVREMAHMSPLCSMMVAKGVGHVH